MSTCVQIDQDPLPSTLPQSLESVRKYCFSSFWSSIQTSHSQDTSPKGSCLSLMCTQGISVKEEDVEKWVVTCFSSQQVTQRMLLMGLCGFIFDVPRGLAGPRQMLHSLTFPSRSPYVPRLLTDLVAKPQVSATRMALASFSRAWLLSPCVGKDVNKLGLPAWSKPVFLLVFT